MGSPFVRDRYDVVIAGARCAGASTAMSLARRGLRVLADGAGLAGYQAARDDRVMGLLDVTDRIASFEWDLDEAKTLHLELARQMNAQVDALLALD